MTINSAWLLAFGALIARRCGPLGFLGLFAASSIAGALFFFLINANQMIPLVGASGGVSGLMGAAFRVIFSASHFGGMQAMREHPNAIPRMPLQVALFDRSTMIGVGLWLAVNLIFGLGLADFLESGDIAWEAHVGGFLFGFLLFRWFDKGPGYKDLREWPGVIRHGLTTRTKPVVGRNRPNSCAPQLAEQRSANVPDPHGFRAKCAGRHGNHARSVHPHDENQTGQCPTAGD